MMAGGQPIPFRTGGGLPGVAVKLRNRITAPDATGTASQQTGEDPLVKIADLHGSQGPVLKVYQVDGATPGTPTYTVTLTGSSVFFDTLQGATQPSSWTTDTAGFTFAYLIPGTAFPVVGQYRIVLQVYLSGWTASNGLGYSETLWDHPVGLDHP